VCLAGPQPISKVEVRVSDDDDDDVWWENASRRKRDSESKSRKEKATSYTRGWE
jgi:hypothetical protein